MSVIDYDICGWATKNNVKCADGRTIMQNAFADQDGVEVPLVWNHNHSSVDNVLGHTLLQNRPEGVYAYAKFNETNNGQSAKQICMNGDIGSFSICANQLREKNGSVFHGVIREVSLVLAGANPEALIENVIMHGEESETDAIIYTGEPIILHNSDEPEDELDNTDVDNTDDESEEPDDKLSHADETKNEDDKSSEDETVEDVLNTMTKKQKTAMYALLGVLIEDDEDDSDEGGTDVKHNIFEGEQNTNANVLSHAAGEEIISIAKSSGVGTLKMAMGIYEDQNDTVLCHDAVASGFAETGSGNITYLYPEYKEVRPGAPELITSDQGWISTVISKVHKSPISRIRTSQVDIRNIEELRARGYIKGKEKAQTGNFNLIRRTTDPQTVYVKSALHRDDIIDITDFDYVDYLYKIDRMQLNEELATAIMVGDGRTAGADGKIDEDKIRPIWTDDDLYTIHADLDYEAAKTELQGTGTSVSFGENYIYAEAMVNTCLYSRETYKGTGTPDMYITPHMLNVMLLARDLNGRRIYGSRAELAQALNVGAIHTVEQFEGKTRTDSSSNTKKLLALIVNLNDYSLGSTKGGEITHFTQFDIDFNQQKSLLETRCSGALTRVYSAIAIEEPVTSTETAG